MVFNSALRRRHFCLYAGVAMAALLLTACQTLYKSSDLTSDPDGKIERLSKEKKDLERSLAKSEGMRKEAEGKLSETQAQLLEKDAQIKGLEEQMASQQKMLDDAVQEVVRAKAKLRSLESRAEAASNMAEAEIAMIALKAEVGAKEQDPDVLKAEQLLKMSAEEFKNENYGGALYLTNQAKSHIKACQTRLRGREGTITEDETPLSHPLALKVLKKSFLRKEPHASSKAIRSLSKGTLVTAYSYKAEWVRITCERGPSGWVLRSAVGNR